MFNLIKNFENNDCVTCGGTGELNYIVCMRCNGNGILLTKRGISALEYYNSLREIKVSDVVVGANLFTVGKQSGLVIDIQQPTEENGYIKIITKSSIISCSSNDCTVTLAHQQKYIDAALAYQNKLNECGIMV